MLSSRTTQATPPTVVPTVEVEFSTRWPTQPSRPTATVTTSAQTTTPRTAQDPPSSPDQASIDPARTTATAMARTGPAPSRAAVPRPHSATPTAAAASRTRRVEAPLTATSAWRPAGGSATDARTNGTTAETANVRNSEPSMRHCVPGENRDKNGQSELAAVPGRRRVLRAVRLVLRVAGSLGRLLEEGRRRCLGHGDRRWHRGGRSDGRRSHDDGQVVRGGGTPGVVRATVTR